VINVATHKSLSDSNVSPVQR